MGKRIVALFLTRSVQSNQNRVILHSIMLSMVSVVYVCSGIFHIPYLRVCPRHCAHRGCTAPVSSC